MASRILVARQDRHTVVYALVAPEFGDMAGLARRVLVGMLAGRGDLLETLNRDAGSALAASPNHGIVRGIERTRLGEAR